MAQQNKQSQFQQPSPRTTIISVVLFMLVAFFVGQQFLNMSSAGAKPTDRLNFYKVSCSMGMVSVAFTDWDV